MGKLYLKPISGISAVSTRSRLERIERLIEIAQAYKPVKNKGSGKVFAEMLAKEIARVDKQD